MSLYTYTKHDQGSDERRAVTSTVALTPDEWAFAKSISDYGTAVGGIRRALAHFRERCGSCACCRRGRRVEYEAFLLAFRELSAWEAPTREQQIAARNLGFKVVPQRRKPFRTD